MEGHNEGDYLSRKAYDNKGVRCKLRGNYKEISKGVWHAWWCFPTTQESKHSDVGFY